MEKVLGVILVFEILISLSGCANLDRISNPEIRHTGTLNEPGTRINPYQGYDYVRNSQNNEYWEDL